MLFHDHTVGGIAITDAHLDSWFALKSEFEVKGCWLCLVKEIVLQFAAVWAEKLIHEKVFTRALPEEPPL